MNDLFALIKAEEQLTSALSVGSYIVEPVLQSKTVQPTREEQEITCDYGFNGLEKVIVEPYEPILQTKTITPTRQQQVVTADDDKDGLDEVVVEPMVLQNKTVTPTTSQQIITSDSEDEGLGVVTVNGVDSSIDRNIQASNIKKGVSILGVNGNVVVEDIPPLDFNISDMTFKLENCSGEAAEYIINNSTGFGNANTIIFNNLKIKKLDPKYECALTDKEQSNSLFRNSTTLTTVSHENGGFFTVPNSTQILNIFQNCKALKTVDLDCFKISNQSVNISDWFIDCTALTSVVNMDLTNARKGNPLSMFTRINKLSTLKFKQGTVWCRNVDSDAEFSLKINSSYKVPTTFTANSMKNMIASLGINDTGYARTFVVDTSYNLTDEVIALAAAKNYSFIKK